MDIRGVVNSLSPPIVEKDIDLLLESIKTIEGEDLLFSIWCFIGRPKLTIFQKNSFLLLIMSDSAFKYLEKNVQFLSFIHIKDKVKNKHSVDWFYFCLFLFSFLKYKKERKFLNEVESEIYNWISFEYESGKADELNCVISSMRYIIASNTINRPFQNIRCINFSDSLYDFISFSEKKLAKYLSYKFLKKKDEVIVNKSNKLVFLFKQISPLLSNTGTKLVLDYVFSLLHKNHANNIEILVTREGVINNKCYSLGEVPFKYLDLKAHAQEHGYQKDLVDRVNVKYFERNEFAKEQLLDSVVSYIAKKKPDSIITTHYKDWLLVDVLHEKFPIVYFSLLSGLYPPYKTDVRILPFGTSEKHKKAGDFFLSYIYFYKDWFDSEGGKFYLDARSRSDKYIISIAVDMFKRIDKKYAQAFFDVVYAKLTLGERWLFLGVSDSEIEEYYPDKFTCFIKNKQLIALRYVNEIDPFLDECKIMVHPPVKGGGRGVARALKKGVKALCHENSDPVNFLPQEWVYSSLAQLFELMNEVENVSYEKNIFNSSYNESGINKFNYAVEYAAIVKRNKR